MIIHIKPPIIVKDWPTGSGLKTFPAHQDLMDDEHFRNQNQTIEPDIATKIAKSTASFSRKRSARKAAASTRSSKSSSRRLRRSSRTGRRTQVARADRHLHGPRRSRQDLADGRDPQDARGRGRSGRHHPAHRRLSRRTQRPADHISRYPGPRSVYRHARARRPGHRHRRARRRGG